LECPKVEEVNNTMWCPKVVEVNKVTKLSKVAKSNNATMSVFYTFPSSLIFLLLILQNILMNKFFI
jgi:hypothetical protein